MQLTFGDAEQEGRCKRTRRKIFLCEMEQVVPPKALWTLIEPHYPKTGGPGRQPYRLETMLRIHLLQQWYALSNPAMKEALCDTSAMRQFTQLGGPEEIQDKTTILSFRRLLEKHQLAAAMFKQINAHPAAKGMSLRASTIIDVTVINAASSTKSADGKQMRRCIRPRKAISFCGPQAKLADSRDRSWH